MKLFFKRKIIKSVGISRINANLIDAAKGLYQLEEPFEYVVTFDGEPYRFIIPEGFITNFASVPKIFWNIFHPTDDGMLVASCIHDYVLGENLHLQPELSRKVFVRKTEYRNGELFCIRRTWVDIDGEIDGYLAADLFIETLRQQLSYNKFIRLFLKTCIKGYYFLTLKGIIRN